MRFSLRTLIVVMLLGGPIITLAWRYWPTKKPVFPPQPAANGKRDWKYFADQATEIDREYRQKQAKQRDVQSEGNDETEDSPKD